ncbi:GAF domain-containing protein [Scytonema millei VB511283]|uniref:GAF domain-containing protein n=2 Tax=Scytonema TaxID=1203 RepID=A0A9X5I7J6_9CYAN|nr:GAF domain-containing protein [Scytonema millei VB511283]
MEANSFEFAPKTATDKYSLTYRNIYRNFRKSSIDIEISNSCGVSQTRKQTDLRDREILNRILAIAIQSLNREDCLDNLLLEIRQAIQTDRVLVYRFDRTWSGTIVAESVTAQFPTAIGCQIDDPCFREYYAQQYSDGRMRAIANIYAADLTDCHIKTLEQFAVKASLVVPITSDNGLLGLLIAHHCDAPRHWQIEEIELFKQLATLVSSILQHNISKQEQQSAVEYAQRLKQMTQIVQQAHSSSDLFDAVTTTVRQVFQADRVLVYRFVTDGSGIVVAESVAPGLPQTLNHPIDRFYRCESEIQQRDNRGVRAIANIYTAGLAMDRIDALEQFAIKAQLVAPIVSNGKLVGSLIAHQCHAPRTWQPIESDLFEQIAIQIGLALDRVALLEYRAAAAKQVQMRQQIALQLRRSRVQSEILTTVTDELKSALQTERVIVYRCDRGSTVIAESVTPGLPQALNHRLDDPLWRNNRTAYEQIGYARAMNNIYTAGLSDRCIHNLERFAVKSSLIAPILMQDELFGLLVAHQCFGFREWQQTEIDFCTQVAIDVGFALEQAQLQEKLAQIAQIVMRLDGNIPTTAQQPATEDKEHDATVAF